jgi:3-oxo-5-alpha-steroid 4-dehydrogenase 3
MDSTSSSINGLTYLVALNAPISIANLVDISRPSTKTCIAFPLFTLASVVQHDCHVYLAGLEKYTLPQRHLFRFVVCPHYTSECIIYVAIAIVAAPEGQAFNRTVLAGLAFVVSNLAVTADSTWKWYAERFGSSSLEGRWRMLPYIF